MEKGKNQFGRKKELVIEYWISGVSLYSRDSAVWEELLREVTGKKPWTNDCGVLGCRWETRGFKGSLKGN